MAVMLRSFAVICAIALAACAAPLLDKETAQTVRVVDLGVNVSQIEGVQGRKIEVEPARIQRDIQANVFNSLQSVPQGARDVNVDIVVRRVHLVSPGESFFLGGASSIEGTVQMSDATTGALMLEPTRVFGTAKGGYLLGGVIGAVIKTNRSPRADYEATIVGFSADVRARLFGTDVNPPRPVVPSEAKAATSTREISGTSIAGEGAQNAGDRQTKSSHFNMP